MDLIDFLTDFYGRLHNYPRIPYWLLTPLRKLTRFFAKIILPYYASKPYKDKGYIEENVIVSFTSFPARIDRVWLVVKSLKRQTVLPEKIILWLSNVQFLTTESIPKSLREEEDDLFEICIVEGDIRSHKKYYYAMRKFPQKTIITCDDDIFYHRDMLKNLIETSRIYKKCVIANICSQLTFNREGNILPYLKWKNVDKAYSCEDLVQIGVGGVLYPPYTLNKMVLDRENFTLLAPLADDIWLNCMARLNGTPIVKSSFNLLPLPIINNGPSLSFINCNSNMNDKQILNIRLFFTKNGIKDVYQL